VASQLEHGRLTTRLRLFTEPDDVRVLERLLNRVVLTGLAIGTGVVSVLMLDTEAGPMITVLGVRFLEALGWTGMTLAIILLLRVLLAVLRSDRRPGAG
jgi:ubiquinone biosynthesis protein